jgi:hypothetical protein
MNIEGDQNPFTLTSPSISAGVFSMNARRFPPPWCVEEYNDACFIVRDHDGQQLAYVYFEDEPGRRSKSRAHPL